MMVLFTSPVYAGSWVNSTTSSMPNVNFGDVQITADNCTDTIFKNLIYNYAGLTKGTAIFEVYNPFDVAIPITMDYYENSGTVTNETYYISETEYYNETEYIYKDTEICNDIPDNKTGMIKSCYIQKDLIETKITQKSREVWKEQANGYIPAGYKGHYKFTGEYATTYITPLSIEWVPKTCFDKGILDIGGSCYAQEKWEWWNVSWGDRVAVTITCANSSGCIYEPVEFPLNDITEITSGVYFPHNLIWTLGETTEIPSMIDNNNITVILANSTESGTLYYLYYDGPDVTPDYSDCSVWTPCWEDTINKSFFVMRDNFEDNDVTDWVEPGTVSAEITTTAKLGDYALNVSGTDGSGHGVYKLFNDTSAHGWFGWYDRQPSDVSRGAVFVDDGYSGNALSIRYLYSSGTITVPSGAILATATPNNWGVVTGDTGSTVANITRKGTFSNTSIDAIGGAPTLYDRFVIADTTTGAGDVNTQIDNIYISTKNNFNLYNDPSELKYVLSSGGIFLSGPADSLTTYNTTISHTFSFAHPTDVTATCNLYYNYSLKGSVTATQNIVTTITATNMAYGIYDWFIDCELSTGTVNSTTRTITRPVPELIITLKDEQTDSEVVGNLSLANSSTSSDHNGQQVYRWNYTNASITGSVTADYNNNVSEERTRYYTFNQFSGSDNYTFYLLKTTEGIVIRFHIVDMFSNAIKGALVTASKSFSGTYNMVDSELTDASGTATLWLDPSTTYAISVSYGSFEDSQYITPTDNDFTIQINVDTSGMSFINMFNGVNFRLTPDTPHSRPICWDTEDQYINFTVTSALSNLDYFGLIVYVNDTILLFNETNTTSTTGGLLSTTINTSEYPVGTPVIATGFLRVAGNIEWEYVQEWTVNNCTYSDISLWGIIQNNLSDSETGLSETGKGIMAILISLFLTVAMAGFISFKGGSFIGIMMLGMFAYMNWLSYTLFFLTCGTLIAVWIITKQGGDF